jgi:3',5'-nucleoside bisphosphate phosphatase
VIDLHTHTDASDGRLSGADLLRRAWLAGLRVLGVTDHDTVAGLPAARAAAAAYGITLVDGIEITAVEGGRDVHVLGYFVDASDPALNAFLRAQSEARAERVREIGARLARLGAAVDVETLLASRAAKGGSIGRPAIATALVVAGHVRSEREAFDRFLGEAGSAWVPRQGSSVETVVGVIHDAGAAASLAHPALSKCDNRIAAWAAAGLDAIEVYHSEHQPSDVARYREMAATLNLAVTGGSDYHGFDSHDRAHLGSVTLPEIEYDRFVARASGERRTRG